MAARTVVARGRVGPGGRKSRGRVALGEVASPKGRGRVGLASRPPVGPHSPRRVVLPPLAPRVGSASRPQCGPSRPCVKPSRLLEKAPVAPVAVPVAPVAWSQSRHSRSQWDHRVPCGNAKRPTRRKATPTRPPLGRRRRRRRRQSSEFRVYSSKTTANRLSCHPPLTPPTPRHRRHTGGSPLSLCKRRSRL